MIISEAEIVAQVQVSGTGCVRQSRKQSDQPRHSMDKTGPFLANVTVPNQLQLSHSMNRSW
jgi:hypothetical protein